jgi:methanogenic corrinoid protein MtbC1
MDGLTQKRATKRGEAAEAAETTQIRGDDRAAAEHVRPDLQKLIGAVEGEVIPRLLLTHKLPAGSPRKPDPTEIETLCGRAIDSDTEGALRQIDRLLADGIGIESIYLHLLGATARLLGEMWEQDRINFLDVTVGLCTLHQILFRLGAGRDDVAAADSGGGRALFAPVAGETHVFGALIVARMFARAGWRTWTELSLSADHLIELVHENEFDVVGLSMSCDRHADTMRETIARLRAERGDAMRPCILVGGHAFDRHADWAEAFGADATAPDPASAVRLAESHLDRRTSIT